MSRILHTRVVSPFWGLVSIRDFDTADYPTGGTGEEEIQVLPGHIYVATQSDTDGDVPVEIRVGEVDVPGLRTVFDGTLSVNSGVLCVTAPAMEDEETFHLPRPGEWSVKIAVRGDPRPTFVALFLDLKEWETATGGDARIS